jgi:hypothetical protein
MVATLTYLPFILGLGHSAVDLIFGFGLPLIALAGELRAGQEQPASWLHRALRSAACLRC